jgi:predicted nucleic acid-binding Zn ribbon protein
MSGTATHCPLCGAALDPANLSECPKCDWVVGYRRRQNARLGTARDRIALVLSIVPGLGHIYKGHRLTGALLMLGAVFAVMACSVAATATAGFGLLLLPLYWAGVMLQVYWLEDRAAQPLATQRKP